MVKAATEGLKYPQESDRRRGFIFSPKNLSCDAHATSTSARVYVYVHARQIRAAVLKNVFEKAGQKLHT